MAGLSRGRPSSQFPSPVDVDHLAEIGRRDCLERFTVGRTADARKLLSCVCNGRPLRLHALHREQPDRGESRRRLFNRIGVARGLRHRSFPSRRELASADDRQSPRDPADRLLHTDLFDVPAGAFARHPVRPGPDPLPRQPAARPRLAGQRDSGPSGRTGRGGAHRWRVDLGRCASHRYSPLAPDHRGVQRCWLSSIPGTSSCSA